MEKIVLTDVEAVPGASSEELANIVIQRIGLMPRKKGSTEKMNKVIIEMYERAKAGYRQKKPSEALMTVEEMAAFAGITRQTMYEYLRRWQNLNLISKASYIGRDDKVVIGYRLNGHTLESAFEKAKVRIANNMDATLKIVAELQKVLKNEKISQSQKKN
ncbi:MAG: helix-turn-helix domain-containing protein [Nanoarchaeota archaeon]|nr:helix-turn-helix domain-containing protein [Nanoarchaeota archaeon]